jgi:hypothetical protein
MNLRTYAFTSIGALTLSAGLAVSPASAAVTSVTSSASVLDVDLTVPAISFWLRAARLQCNQFTSFV